MHNIRKVLAVLPALVLAAVCPLRTASAQTIVDQGTFRLSMAGREVGRDSFNILRSGSGEDARILAQGWVELDQRRINSIVETTAGYGLTRYQATVSGAGSADTIKVQVSGRRLELTVRSPAGERMREARAPSGVVLLEENVAHQYFFVGVLAREGGSIPVIAPGGDAGALEVQSLTRESVTIGGQPIDATRLGLSANGVERRLWIDAQGRVLRLEIPSTGFLAERLRAPA
jgi:hypothetical protein